MCYFLNDAELQQKIVVLLDPANADEIVEGFCSFDFEKSTAFDPNERMQMLRLLGALGVDRCNSIIRKIGFLLRKQRQS